MFVLKGIRVFLLEVKSQKLCLLYTNIANGHCIVNIYIYIYIYIYVFIYIYICMYVCMHVFNT